MKKMMKILARHYLKFSKEYEEKMRVFSSSRHMSGYYEGRSEVFQLAAHDLCRLLDIEPEDLSKDDDDE